MKPVARWMIRGLLVWAATAAGWSAETVVVGTPMAPPAWALLEQQLLKANSDAAEEFAARYVDARGYLLHTPRWGTLDGPDDAIETFFNWTLLYSMGGRESVLKLYDKALDGHLQQYGEMRTVKTKLAANGAYHKEFITQSDWFHTGEGMRGFLLYGLANPHNRVFQNRMKRFAGMYMNEDPEAPNYDPEHKVIKSLWTGSLGPMMHKATVYDWVGDPVPGEFHLLHSPYGRKKLVNLESFYDRMLAHCAEYLDSVGDHPLNLGATTLALNAYMLGHEKKYKDWLLEYVGAWKERTLSNGGNIPTNIGLDGKVGGEYGGRWYKGTYGWNFTIYDGELQQVGHRNTFTTGSWPGFSNAFLLSADPSFVGVLRGQMDNLYAQKKVVDGKEMLPQMFGDPRGYKYTGQEEWYHWTPNLFTDRLTEIYLWSMDRKDLERVPKKGWIGYLEGQDAGYPEKSLNAALAELRSTLEAMRQDDTTPDTRLADYLMQYNAVQTDELLNLMMGGYFSNGKVWVLHSRLRYFDPEKRRPGVPDAVGALVDKLTADSVGVTLVNTDPVHPRTVIVQAGGYGEHQFTSVEWNGEKRSIDDPHIQVRLAPGAGARLVLGQKRYVNQPTLAQPWD